ncbi:MAG: putative ATPase, partial [Frankiaceae bacterium]|nr:putative ATPase [Frankiaceae bacterium]
AVVHLATAPKSNRSASGIWRALADVREGVAGEVPPHLRDAHYPGARRLQHGKDYRYPHELPGGVVAQQYAPDTVAGRDYYRPSERGAERAAAGRLAALREMLRGAAAGEDQNDDEREQRSR